MTVRSSTRRDLLRATAALGVLCATGLASPQAQARGLKVGQRAPRAVLITLDGERISTQDLLGQVVVLTFWATYCGPCRDELPVLSAYAAQHASEGLTVLGFCLDDADQLEVVRRVGQTLSFPVGILREDSAPGYGRIWRMPVSFTIDREGRLVDDGWKDPQPVWTQERLQRIVAPLLTTRA